MMAVGWTPRLAAVLLLGAGCSSPSSPPDLADLRGATPDLARAPDLAQAPDLAVAGDLARRSWPQVVVMQSRLRDFTTAAEQTASVSFAVGPRPAPLGLGSLHLQTGAGTGANLGGKAWLYLPALSGTALADLDAFSYRTFVSAASQAAPQLAASVNLQVDVDGDGARDTTLVFEPVYAPEQGAVVKDAWQSWDAGAGKWWATVATKAFCSPACPFTLRDFVAAHPSARIVNWGDSPALAILAGQKAGGAWANFDGYVDRLVLGIRGAATTYDFEPEADACRGGAAASTDPVFQSEAECVGYHQ